LSEFFTGWMSLLTPSRQLGRSTEGTKLMAVLDMYVFLFLHYCTAPLSSAKNDYIDDRLSWK